MREHPRGAALPCIDTPQQSANRWILWSYVLAPVLTAVVTGIRLRLGDQYGPLLLIMFLPVLLIAFRGGLGPGLLCTALSATSTWIFVIPQNSTFQRKAIAIWPR